MESREIRLKRLRMRSIRRGILEMDILLGRFSEHLSDLSDPELDRYETLLDEGDQDLLAWVTGQEEAPAALTDLLTRIKKFAA